MPSKTTINWQFNDIWCFLFTACFDWILGIFQQTVVRVSYILNGIFLIKVYNFWAEKVQKSYVWWHWRLMQNLKENWLVLPKMTWGNWQIFADWKIAILFEKVNGGAKSKSKFKEARSTRCNVKSLFYLGN